MSVPIGLGEVCLKMSVKKDVVVDLVNMYLPELRDRLKRMPTLDQEELSLEAVQLKAESGDLCLNEIFRLSQELSSPSSDPETVKSLLRQLDGAFLDLVRFWKKTTGYDRRDLIDSFTTTATPTSVAHERRGWVDAGPASALVNGEASCLAVDLPNTGDRVAVFYTGGSFYAIGATCPHQGADLSEGDIEDGVVVCPVHGWRFRLNDGQCVKPALMVDESVPAYPVRQEGNHLMVCVEDVALDGKLMEAQSVGHHAKESKQHSNVRLGNLVPLIGEEAVKNLATLHYTHVWADEEAPWFAKLFTDSMTFDYAVFKLQQFFLHEMGGTCVKSFGETYKVDKDFVKARHSAFPIDDKGLERWLHHMRNALDEADLGPKETRDDVYRVLWEWFTSFGREVVEDNPSNTSNSKCPVEH